MMRSLIFALVIAQAIAIPIFDSFDEDVYDENYNDECPRFFDRNGTSCYRVVDSLNVQHYLTWSTADQFCTFYEKGTYRGHLVTIETEEEHEFVRSLLPPANNLGSRNYWVGSNTVDARRGWLWVTNNNNITYTPWAEGEPAPGLNRNCMLMYGLENYNFAADQCWSFRPFVCEVDLEGPTSEII